MSPGQIALQMAHMSIEKKSFEQLDNYRKSIRPGPKWDFLRKKLDDLNKEYPYQYHIQNLMLNY